MAQIQDYKRSTSGELTSPTAADPAVQASPFQPSQTTAPQRVNESVPMPVAPSMFGNISETISQLASKFSNSFASQAGEDAAGKDAAENPGVFHKSFWAGTPYGEAYNKTAQLAFTTRKKNDIDNNLAKLARDNLYNPQGYQDGLTELKTSILDNSPSHLLPILSAEFDKVSNTHQETILKNQSNSIHSQNMGTILGKLDDLSTSIQQELLKPNPDTAVVESLKNERNGLLNSATLSTSNSPPILSGKESFALREKIDKNEGLASLYGQFQRANPSEQQTLIDQLRTGNYSVKIDAHDALSISNSLENIRNKQQSELDAADRSMLNQSKFILEQRQSGIVTQEYNTLVDKVSKNPSLYPTTLSAIQTVENRAVSNDQFASMNPVVAKNDLETLGTRIKSGNASEEEIHQYDMKLKAYNDNIKFWQDDSLGYASKVKSRDISGFDINNPSTWDKRKQDVLFLGNTFGEYQNGVLKNSYAGINTLTTSELNAYRDAYKSSNPDNRTLLISNVAKFDPNRSTDYINQITNGDKTITTVSGLLKVPHVNADRYNQETVAKVILGNSLLETNKSDIPDDAVVERAITDKLRVIFPTIEGNATISPEQFAAMMKASKALYAVEISQTDKHDFNQKLVDKSVARLLTGSDTGGHSMWSGAVPGIASNSNDNTIALLPPILGMNNDKTSKLFASLKPDDIKAGLNGVPTDFYGSTSKAYTAEDVINRGSYISAGPGKYYVSMKLKDADDNTHTVLMKNESGQPLLLDFNKMPDVLSRSGIGIQPNGATIPALKPNRIPSAADYTKLYGNPDDANFNSNLVSITAPWKDSDGNPLTVKVHKEIAGATQSAFNDIWNASGNNQQVIQKWGMDKNDGGHANRNIEGTNNKSSHAWGMAIDFDSDRNPNTFNKPHSMPDDVVNIFEKYGFVNLGKQTGKDWMHFQYVPTTKNEVKLTTGYFPQKAGDSVEGDYKSSTAGPDGVAQVRTLSDFYSGNSPYVTLASDPSNYGKVYSFIDPATKKTVYGVVHDTGGDFQGKPQKIDIAMDRDIPKEKRVVHFPSRMNFTLVGRVGDASVNKVLNLNG